jgi:hypothetical protein
MRSERRKGAEAITKPIRFIIRLPYRLRTARERRRKSQRRKPAKPSKCKTRRKMFNKILFIIIYFNITIQRRYLFLWKICAFEFLFQQFYFYFLTNNRESRLITVIIHSPCLLLLPLRAIKGSSVRPLSSQHRGLYSRQRIQLEELAHDTSTGPAHLGPVAVRS